DNDTFILQAIGGLDTILDYRDGEDRLGFLDGALTFDDLTIVQVGSSVLIRTDSDRLATLVGVDAEVLTVDDFTAIAIPVV
ncbi:MAG: hypothetical protein WBA10_14135, partial [Elainellaceae cyanobacterium]